MKTAFLILGAQRSGTSVASHLLSQFGVNFGNPQNFIQFDHNPIFFELKWVNEFNNKLVNALGHEYIDFFLPIEADFEQANITAITTVRDSKGTVQEIQTLIDQEWNGASVIGIKDPRISLTFPIWRNLLSRNGYELKIVLVFRHPASFLESNKRLFQNWEGWTNERHLDFWLQLNLAAVYFTREFPIHYLNYDRLISNPVEETRSLAINFNLDSNLIHDAVSVVNQSYSHHQTFASTGYSLVDRCYQSLCSRSVSPDDYLTYRRIRHSSELSSSQP